MQETTANESAVRGAHVEEGADTATGQFRDFYAALAKARRAATRLPQAEAAAGAQALSNDLLQLIEVQTLEARRIDGRQAGQWDAQARYLKAALADEIMLNDEWAGRDQWRHVLLEARLFRSSFAGDKVFDAIEELLSLREPAQRPLARLYLYALSLGFQGRLRGSQSLDRLAQLRRELFQFAYQRPADLQGAERALSGKAYDSTLSYLSAARLPRLSRWGLVLTLVMLVLLVLSQALWLWQSWPLRQAVAQAAPGLATVWGA